MAVTSATSGCARFVGRVGALAVALGVGAAIVNSAAIASAETGDPDTSATSSQSASDSAPDNTPGPRKPSFGGREGVTKRLRSLTTKVESALDNSKANQKSTGRSAKADVETAVDNVRQTVSRAITKATGAPGKRRATSDNRPRSTPATDVETAKTGEAPTSTSTPRVETAQAHVVPKLVSDVFTAERLTPRTPQPPVNPATDIGLAALLGWSRRADTAATTSTLATEDQLEAEQQVSRIVDTPIVQAAKVVLMAAWYVEAVKNFSAVGGPDLTNLSQLNQAATEYANQSATEFLLLDSNDPKLLLQVNPPHTWAGQDAGGTRIWYDNPDTVYRFTGINGASTYRIEGTVQGYDPADPSTHPTSSNANFSVLTGINGVTAANLNGEELSVRDDGTFTVIVSPDPAPANPEIGMNYLQAPSDSTILATRNTLSDWNTDKPMTLTIEQVDGPPSSLFSQIGGFAIPGVGSTVVENPTLLQLVSVIPPMKNPPVILQATETALLMLVTGISGENTYMSVATATGAPNTLSQPAHNAQFLSTQLQSAGYFQLADDEAMIITVQPGDAEYFVVPVTNDWTITGNTRDEQTSLNNSQAVKNEDGSYTIVVSKQDPGVANWVSTGELNQGTISMRFQGVDPNSTNTPTVTTQVVKLDEVKDYVEDNQDTYDRAQQIADRQAGYDLRYTV